VGETESSVTELDAGPVIHLDQLGGLDLVEGLGAVYLPATVKEEILRHRPSLSFGAIADLNQVADPDTYSTTLIALRRSFDLHAGELAALGLLAQLRGDLFLCDDAAARLAAESLGYRVHGTIGLLIRAIRRSKRSSEQVRTTLKELPHKSTLHISRPLLDQVIAQLPA